MLLVAGTVLATACAPDAAATRDDAEPSAGSPDVAWVADALPGHDARTPPADAFISPDGAPDRAAIEADGPAVAPHDVGPDDGGAVLASDGSLPDAHEVPLDAARSEDAETPPVPDAGAIAPEPDAGVVCPAPRPSIDTCLRGQAFARCDGPGEPRLFCGRGEGGSRCRWFEGGCPASEYPFSCPVLDPCPDDDCWDARAMMFRWGTRPWTADREMNISAVADPAVEVAPPAIQCGECALLGDPPWQDWAGECLLGPGPCDGLGVSAWQDASSNPVGDTFISVEWTSAEFYYWSVVLEFGVYGGSLGTARVCLVPSSDFLNDCTSNGPICATSGQAWLSQDVDGGWHGRLEAEFGPYRGSLSLGPNQFAGMRMSIGF
jgi:hypothetical protein